MIDLRSRRIPNNLTAGMAMLGIGLAATGASGISIPTAFGGLILGLLLMMPGYRLGATGAGDVKLMGAVGSIVGPSLIIWAFLFTSLVGGLLALVVAIRRKRLGATLAGTGRLVAAPASAQQQIKDAGSASRFAYGPAIALGSVIAVLIR